MTSAPTFDFTGALVCVTGGTSGIGLGVAEAFAAAGAEVVVTGTRPSPGEYEIRSRLAAFEYVQMNTRSPASIDALVGSLERLDVLVNNAGANFPDGLDEATPDGFDASVELNLLGGHRLIRGCHSLLKASHHEGGAAVVSVSSMSAYRPVAVVPGYGAAKAAVIQMTKQLGLTWAADGIRVNAVAPGLIETNMTAPMKEIPDLVDPEMTKVPMARWGTPADVAPTFLFLASPAAAFITGQTVNVDGGYTLT